MLRLILQHHGSLRRWHFRRNNANAAVLPDGDQPPGPPMLLQCGSHRSLYSGGDLLPEVFLFFSIHRMSPFIRFHCFSHGVNEREASVVSKAKSVRCRASSFSRVNIARPAAKATDSGRKADSPCAISSAFTNSTQPTKAGNISRAVVLLPAPFGP